MLYLLDIKTGNYIAKLDGYYEEGVIDYAHIEDGKISTIRKGMIFYDYRKCFTILKAKKVFIIEEILED